MVALTEHKNSPSNLGYFFVCFSRNMSNSELIIVNKKEWGCFYEYCYL